MPRRALDNAEIGVKYGLVSGSNDICAALFGVPDRNRHSALPAGEGGRRKVAWQQRSED
ncbi:hypothetical protein [Methanoculleus taiwanensis]|uniref:hypothetical protein n=1 Tax=Methanoculleus taiwanensis TaxID=1550565 RepID=UPI0013E8D4B4|nr:hypothetical protein [Methanoculleus taiwanensis]